MITSGHLTSIERRLADLESHLDQHQRNVTVSDTKFDQDKKRWYVKVQDKYTEDQSSGSGSSGSSDGQSATNPDADPNFKSDWLPWHTFSHDTIHMIIPPRKKQRVTLNSPYGRPEMGHVAPYHNGPDTPCPSGNPDEIRIQIKPPPQDNSSSSSSSGSSGSSGSSSSSSSQSQNSTLDIIANANSHTLSVGNALIKVENGKVTITVGSTNVTFEDKKVTFDTKTVKFGKQATHEVSYKGTVDTGGYADEGPVSTIILTE